MHVLDEGVGIAARQDVERGRGGVLGDEGMEVMGQTLQSHI